MKLKNITILLVATILLSSCGGNDNKVNLDKTIDQKKSSDLGTIKSEETGEVFTENDGELIPGEQKIEDINVFMLNLTCSNEAMPEIIDRISYDYDLDQANDAAIVTKCPNIDEFSVTVFRATTRGWWNKFTISPSMAEMKVIGSCEAQKSQLVCEGQRFNKISNETTNGYIVLAYENNDWVILFNDQVFYEPTQGVNG